MKKDFSVDQAIALKGEGFYYDLHNDYCFRGLALDVNEDTPGMAMLRFAKIQGSWVKPEDPQEIILMFFSVSHIAFSPEFFDSPQQYIADIGFRTRKTMKKTSFVREEDLDSMEGMDLAFFFEEGGRIQINAERVEVKVSEVIMSGVQ